MPGQQDAWGTTWKERSASHPSEITSWERDLGWWDARASLDVVEKGEF